MAGWRAWLAGAVALLAAWLVLAFAAFVLVGIAVSVGAALIILLPAVLLVSIVASYFRR
jgi:hypothetical protein